MGPGVRFAYLSYDAELSTNHSIKCRDLIESPWYHDLWPERFCLTQNLKTHYDNNRGGESKYGTIHGMTGFGANILGYDDPHDLQNVESDVKRNEVLKFYTEQRSHSRDISGHIIAQEIDAELVDIKDWTPHTWRHICLPGRRLRKEQQKLKFLESVVEDKDSGAPEIEPCPKIKNCSGSSRRQ
jgi:hypothetical protein